ncbi:MAG: peptide chain release factor N(5)-glutamine methyltransferase [Actinomycetia bacterium]|nr:peptide chain release factor N(5)-glutamine methyltransferase [Actinomycetes bacterium]
MKVGISSPGEATTTPWRDLLAEAEERLTATGLPSPGVDARWIVEHASGHGSDLSLHLGDPVTNLGMARFDRMIARREAGEPLQYVLGRWGFRTLDLMVDRRVLIPRPETETVVGHLLVEYDRLVAAGHSGCVVDLGTGSGAIALSVAAERSGVEVWATDKSAEALIVARGNLAGVGRPATRVRMAEGSWFSALPAELAGSILALVSNPPYVAPTDELPSEVADWEPTDALISYPTGLEAIAEIVSQAPDWLHPAGVLVVELAPSQASAAVEAAWAAGFSFAEVRLDLAGRARALVARC